MSDIELPDFVSLIFDAIVVDDIEVRKQTLCFFSKQLRLDKFNESLPEVEGFVHNILKLSETKMVVFVARNYTSFPSIISALRYFKEKGYVTVGIYLDNLPEQNEFDLSYNCHESLASLLYILSKANKNFPIYLQAHGKWASLLVLIRSINHASFIIHEIYDWVSDFIGEKEGFIEKGIFTKNDIELVQYYESRIMSYANIILYKNSSLLADMNNSKSLRIYPIVNIKLDNNSVQKSLPDNENYRFLFAGQIKSKSSPDEIYGDIDFLELIKKICSQKIFLSYFNAPFFSQLFEEDEYSDYFSESHTNNFFSFNKGVPRQDLIEQATGKYHAGLILYRRPEKFLVGKKHIEGAFDSKIFTYLEAGLPIIVSEEFKFMADFIRKNKVGLVVSKMDLDNLKPILQNTDFKKLQNNIPKALKECNNNSVFHELMSRIENLNHE